MKFIKMNGLGNDFVIFDSRAQEIALNPDQIRRIANRTTGVGCDQVLVISAHDASDAAMTVHNADGSTGAAMLCANGLRCVAHYLCEDLGRDSITVFHAGAVRACQKTGPLSIEVAVGQALYDWQDIPLAEKVPDPLAVDLKIEGLPSAACVNVGNPHAVFFADEADTIDLERLGPQVETHPLFPERTNVHFAEVRGTDRLYVRTWERGSGLTQACGSGACAVAAIAHKLGHTSGQCQVEMPGGGVAIDISAQGDIVKTGPVAYSFRGAIDANMREAPHE